MTWTSKPSAARNRPVRAADGEQSDEAERVEHRGGVGDGTLVQGGCPVKDFDGRRDCHKVAEEREDQSGVNRLRGDEQVMAPHQAAEHRDGHAGVGHEMVAEDRLAREHRDHFADHTHGRQHHDVHGRVRVEPEEMLEQHRVAAQSGIEDADVEYALAEKQDDGHRQDRRSQHLDQRRGVIGPHEQRQARPGHARRAHAVHRHDEVEAGENRRESGHENSQGSSDHPAIRIGGAVRRVEGPPGVDARPPAWRTARTVRRSPAGTSSAG